MREELAFKSPISSLNYSDYKIGVRKESLM